MDNIDDFDNVVRKMAKEESVLLPNGYEERQNKLLSSLRSESIKEKRFIGFKTIKVAAFILAFLICGVSVAADSLTGGAFFAKFFNNKAREDITKDYSYMNTEQLSDLESSTTGTVVDTDELTVDVLGILKSGNTADIMLKVTANKLDSVLYDTNFDTLPNYRFNDEISGSLFDSAEQMTVGYIYSDEDKELEPNQFEIFYTIISSDKFSDEYTIELNNFGYFTHGSGVLTEFVSIYDKIWDFKVSLDSNLDSYKTVYINKPIKIDDISLTVDCIKITPLACTIKFSTDTEYSDEFFKEFSDGIDYITIELKDGTILDNSDFDYGCGTGDDIGTFDAHLNFDVPISLNSVTSISLFGVKFYMK